ncbi:MAG: hypothetical protein PUE61_06475 [Clostridiales bacterium]|nr:hypothetical protein [Clostridiales bacterium]
MKCLRSLLILMMIAVLMLPCMGAVAAEKPLQISYLGSLELAAGGSGNALKTRVNSTETGEIIFTLTDMRSKNVVHTESRSGIAAGQEITWSVPYDKNGLSYSQPVKRMKAAFEMDGKTYTYNLYYRLDEDGKTICVERATWYPDNTACSFGPQFREVRPGLTDKWYMFTPIDLSVQGVQEYEYAASNLYVIGKVYVHVAGDQVTVTYQNFYETMGGNTQTQEEFFTFFPDLASVTDVNPETMGISGFAFGQPISIQNDLAGDTNVLLFVRNKVTYADYVTNSAKLPRFWINHPDRVMIRNEMLSRMD